MSRGRFHRILLLSQGDVSDRSSRNFTLGYIILALQAEKKSAIELENNEQHAREGQSWVCEM